MGRGSFQKGPLTNYLKCYVQICFRRPCVTSVQDYLMVPSAQRLTAHLTSGVSTDDDD